MNIKQLKKNSTKAISLKAIGGLLLSAAALTSLSGTSFAADYSRATIDKTTITPSAGMQVQAKKADLVILSVSAVGGQPNKFGVQIKNQGQVTCNAGIVSGKNMSGGGLAQANLPYFKPGEQKHVFVTFQRGAPRTGDRVQFYADASNAVSESNENNNKKFINAK